MTKTLIVEDHAASAALLAEVLGRQGHSVEIAPDGETGARLAAEGTFDLVVTDLRLPKRDGLEVTEAARRSESMPAVLVVTAHGTIEMAVQCIRMGAYDFLTKPLSLERIQIAASNALAQRAMDRELRALRNENATLRQATSVGGLDGLIGVDGGLCAVAKIVRQVAPTTSVVLIRGESGTGKELVARAIHELSPRAGRPFIRVNCAAFAPGVLESELFGHEKGAFTGAVSQRAGRFELAEDGTLFLDEIGDVEPSIQIKLLRVTQERELERVGGSRTIAVRCRIVAATNRDLEKAIAEGRFREDLYYRLNVVPIRLPALRERREDIPLLVGHFLGKYSDRCGKPLLRITPELLSLLTDHSWPGNVRELENLVERLVVLAQGDVLNASDMPPELLRSPPLQASETVRWPIDLTAHLDGLERQMLADALAKAGGVKSKAAELLGLERNAFRYKLVKFGIE
ncbi:MAG: sigma-54-dependent transcriptional regulator [Deltaproteobacteria bacterium]